MNLIEVGDRVRIFNEREIMDYMDAGGQKTAGLLHCPSQHNVTKTIAEIEIGLGFLLTDDGVYVPEELAELL